MYIQKITIGITLKIDIVDNSVVLEQMDRAKSLLKVSEQCKLWKLRTYKTHLISILQDTPYAEPWCHQWVIWRTMPRTPRVSWKIFILALKLFQEWVMPLNSQKTKQIFFVCYHFDWNNSSLLKAMKMNQTYLWGKDSTVSTGIKIFHFSCSIQSTCHSPLKLQLLYRAPTSLREKIHFMKSNKNLSFYIGGDCFWQDKLLFRALNSFKHFQVFCWQKKKALSLTFKSMFALNTYFKTG